MIVKNPQVSFYGLPLRATTDRDALKDLVHDVIRSGEFILRERVRKLERLIANRIGVEHAVAVSSGTSALRLALTSLDLAPEDEVVVPAFGFHSALTMVLHSGARPLLADIESRGVLSVESAAAVCSERTRAIVPAHVFSSMADMTGFESATEGTGLRVIENSAIAFGMSLNGRSAGTWGDLAVFSFHPYKPLAATSDAGAIVTDDRELARRVRMLRNHGQDGRNRFLHHMIGFNARMDEITAGMLLHRLEGLDETLRRRTSLARRYEELLEPLEEVLVRPPLDAERPCYVYVVRSGERDALEQHLAHAGIETMVYYPLPLHLQPAFKRLGYAEGSFPVAEKAAREFLALPLYPEMPDEHVEVVARSVLEFHGA